jgi:uncharacterized protein (TIGR03086 family)
MMTLTGRALDAHARAQSEFGHVLDNVTPDMLERSTPCRDWMVRDLIVHVAGGNHRVANHDLAPVATLDELVVAYRASALDAQRTFDEPGALERTFDVPFGAVPGAVYIQLRTIDVLTHAWDLAVATDQGTDIEPELADAMLEVSRGLVRPDLRGVGRPFDDEQPAGRDRTAADRLAAFLGRPLVGA